MIVESPYKVDIPPIDIPTFVFNSGTAESRRAKQYFDATNPSKCFSIEEAKGMVKQFGHGLQKMGMKPQDKVLLFSNNSLYFPIFLWGTIAAGCVFTAASSVASAEELAYQLKDSQSKLLFTSSATVRVAEQAAALAGIPRDHIMLFCDPDSDLSIADTLGIKPWTSIWSSPIESTTWAWKKITTPEEAGSTTAIINYSSGTTGLPKGVEITHLNSVANSIQLTHKLSLVADTPEGRARDARLQLSGQRWLAVLPMYHVMGQTWFCMNAVRIGAKVFVMPKYELLEYMKYVDIYRITFMQIVPTIIASMTKLAHPERFNFKAIETVVSGSAPLNLEIAELFSRMYLRPGVNVKQGLGMTESTCSLLGFAADDRDDGRSVGWLHANCRGKIVPVEGRDFSHAAPAGTTSGELWVAGPNVMKGYYMKDEETANSIVDENGHRWLRTGDIAYVDNRGCFYVIDRLKDLIKVKGIQVAPAELELALLAHPDIVDAAVVGAKISGSEYPRAFVVRKRPKLTEEDVTLQIKNKLARHKWLTGGVFFVEKIPRTGSGKVIRRQLPDPEAEQKKQTKL